MPRFQWPFFALGTQLQILVEVGERFLDLAELEAFAAAVVVRLGQLAVEVERLVEVGDGLLVFAHRLADQTADEAGAGVRRCLADRLVSQGQRLLRLPLLQSGLRLVEQISGGFRRNQQCHADECNQPHDRSPRNDTKTRAATLL